jgi:endonuclease YncB( thermonuclease family)
VLGKTVKVEQVDVDRYGRTVGIVTVGDLVLNRHLVEYGYA